MKEQTKSEACISEKFQAYLFVAICGLICVLVFMIGFFIGGSWAFDYSKDVITQQNQIIDGKNNDLTRLKELNADWMDQYNDALSDKQKMNDEAGLMMFVIARDDEVRDLVVNAYEMARQNFTEAEQKEYDDLELELEEIKKELKEEMSYE